LRFPTSFGQTRTQQSHDLDRPDRSSTPELPDPHPRGYPTIHLSKSSSYPYAKILIEAQRQILLQTPVATFVTVVVSPDWGRRILASRLAVSTAVGEDFPARVASAGMTPDRGDARPRTADRFRTVRPLSTFGCCDPQRSAVVVLIAAVQAPRPTITEGR
jgi:hypothetical protein